MKNSRKTEKTVLAGTALAAFAAVAWWWSLDGPTPHAERAARSAPTTSSIAATSAPAPEAGASPVSPPAVAQAAPASAPEGGTPTSAEPTAPAPAAAGERVPAHTTAESSSPAAANADASKPAPETSTGAVTEANEGAAAPVEETPRHDEALDLFAERIAKLEQTTSADPADASDARLLNEFNARAPDDESAPQRVKVLRDHIGAWLAGFPAERVDHLRLVSVECRTAACQVLIAEEIADVSAELHDTFVSSFNALASEDWCRDIGLVVQSIAIHAAGQAGDKPDHALWTIYLGNLVAG